MPKKTTEIIINSNNAYVVTVKKNQSSLYKLLEKKSRVSEAIDIDVREEKVKGREIKRTVQVFDNLSSINQQYWRGIKSFIKVVRESKRGLKAYTETVYYISSLLLSAEEFSQKIQEHWLIENQLHWVRDVVLQEDQSKIRSGNAPQNMAIIRSIVMNIFHHNGYKSLTEGIRIIGNNISYLLLFLSGKIYE